MTWEILKDAKHHNKHGRIYGWNGQPYPRLTLSLHLTKGEYLPNREQSDFDSVYFAISLREEESKGAYNVPLPVALMKDCAEMLLGINEDNRDFSVYDILNVIEAGGYADALNNKLPDNDYNDYRERTPAWEAYEAGYEMGLKDR